jgi:hypothetical protein
MLSICKDVWKKVHSDHSRTRFNLSAFATTVNDESAIAAPANIGDINSPVTG